MSLVDLQYDPPQGWFNNSMTASIAVPACPLGMWEAPSMVLPQHGNRVICVETVLEFQIDGRNLQSNVVFTADLGVTNTNVTADPNAPYKGFYHLKTNRVVTVRSGEVEHVQIRRWDIVDPAQCDPTDWQLELGADGAHYPAIVPAFYNVPVALTLLNFGMTMEVKG